MPSKRPDDNRRQPTTLVVHNDTELRSALADGLRHDGYDVLEAHDLPSFVEISSDANQTRPFVDRSKRRQAHLGESAKVPST